MRYSEPPGVGMTSLTDFLAARLQEDEDTARAASPGPWLPNAEHDEVHAADGVPVCEGFALSSNQLRNTVDFVASHDPARALREIAAKRRILERHCRSDVTDRFDYCAGCPSGDDSGYPDVDLEDCPELQDMAFIWNDHEDWSLEWCPHVEGRYQTPVTEVPPRRGYYTNICNRCGAGDGWHRPSNESATTSGANG